MKNSKVRVRIRTHDLLLESRQLKSLGYCFRLVYYMSELRTLKSNVRFEEKNQNLYRQISYKIKTIQLSRSIAILRVGLVILFYTLINICHGRPCFLHDIDLIIKYLRVMKNISLQFSLRYKSAKQYMKVPPNTSQC